MEAWVLAGAVHGLYLSILFHTGKNRDIPELLLEIYFFITSLTYIAVYLSVKYDFEIISLFLWNSNLLISPFLLLYFNSLTNTNNKQKTIIAFLPFILSFFYLLYIIVFSSHEELEFLFSPYNLMQKKIVFILFQMLEYFYFPIIAIITLSKMYKHKKNAQHYCSSVSDIEIKWFRIFLLICISLWTVNMATYYILPELSAWIKENRYILSVIVTLPLFFVQGFFSMRQKVIFRESINNKKNENSYMKTGLEKKERKQIAIQLDNLVKKKKLYLIPQLSLFEMEKQTGLTRHNISEILSCEFNKNFYEYINTLRIEEFEEKIRNKEHEKFTLLAIALECGFNSKASFNRVFKTLTGKTPSGFIKTVKPFLEQ